MRFARPGRHAKPARSQSSCKILSRASGLGVALELSSKRSTLVSIVSNSVLVAAAMPHAREGVSLNTPSDLRGASIIRRCTKASRLGGWRAQNIGSPIAVTYGKQGAAKHERLEHGTRGQMRLHHRASAKQKRATADRPVRRRAYTGENVGRLCGARFHVRSVRHCGWFQRLFRKPLSEQPNSTEQYTEERVNSAAWLRHCGSDTHLVVKTVQCRKRAGVRAARNIH